MDANTLESIMLKPVETHQETPDILRIQFPIVNTYLVGDPNTKNPQWVLVGGGVSHGAKAIFQAAAQRFGANSKPTAIILTHGHFDHVGSIMELVTTWQVPVYAHELELPYLNGQQDYPPADPSVDEGLIAQISPTFPHQGINIGTHLKALPADGGIPGMEGWRWIHTPGHSPGHVSLFRDADKVLIVGDAFTTVKQSSADAVMKMEKEINGPPAYFTTDWQAAYESVKALEQLKPAFILPFHGRPMKQAEYGSQLKDLVENFEEKALPKQGKYVEMGAPV